MEIPFVFTWHIENFTMLRYKRFDSPEFRVHRLGHMRWFLQLRTDGPKDLNFTCYLCRSPYEALETEIVIGTTTVIVTNRPEPSPEQTIASHRCTEAFQVFRETLENVHQILDYTCRDVLSLRCTIWGHLGPDPTPEVIQETEHFSSSTIAEEHYAVFDEGRPGLVRLLPSRCSARTFVEVFRHSFTWVIHQLDLKDSTRKSTIRVESALRDAGSLSLTFHYVKDSDHLLNFEVRRIVPDPTQLTYVRCSITIVSDGGKKHKTYAREDHLFWKEHTWAFTGSRDPATMPKRARRKWYREAFEEQGTLKLQVEMSVSHEGCTYQVDTSPVSDAQNAADEALAGDLARLRRDKTLSDVLLGTPEHSIRANKNILSGRSPVFRTMLNSDMAEGQTGVVHVPDVDPDILSKLVTFVYTTRFKITAEDALQLYIAADKYDIPTLKEECALYLTTHLSPETVPDALVVAKVYGDLNLLDFVKKYMAEHANQVLHTEEWEELMKESHQLATETALEVLREKMDYV